MSTSNAKTSVRSYHHGDLRAELIRSAQVLLEREGVTKLSLRAAARLAGVSQTAPYRHFTDKAALLAAVAAVGFRGLAAAMRRGAARAGSAEKRMLEIGSAYLAFAVENSAVFRLMFGSEIPDKAAHPELRWAAEDAFAVLAGEMPAGPDGSDAAIAAWSFVHGLATLLIDGQIRSEMSAGAPFDPVALTRRFGRFLDFSKARVGRQT